MKYNNNSHKLTTLSKSLEKKNEMHRAEKSTAELIVELWQNNLLDMYHGKFIGYFVTDAKKRHLVVFEKHGFMDQLSTYFSL